MTRRAPSHLLATLGLSSALLLTPGFAVAAQHDNHAGHNHTHGKPPAFAQSALNRARATAATTDFVAAHKEWAQARGATNKAVTLETLIEKANARRAVMAELIRTNPAEALRVAIPQGKQPGMPAEVQTMLEQKFEISGQVEAIYEDYSDGSNALRHYLNAGNGKRFELHFAQADQVPYGTNQSVSVSGILLESDESIAQDADGDIAVSSSESLLYLNTGGTSTQSAETDLTPEIANTLGDQRTLLVLINFQDKPEEPWTVNEAQQLLFGDVNNFIQENSDGRTWLTGDVAGWFTVPLSSTDCSSRDIKNQANYAASVAGYDISQYDRLIYAFPQNSCGYAGSGSVGGLPSVTYINNSLTLSVVAHELGHNLGLYHATAKECGADVLGNNCYTVEYGDTLDTMGYFDTVGHFNTFEKSRLGWLSSSEVLEVTNSGNFDLVPFAQNSTSGLKALKIQRSHDSTTGNSSWYFVEYRQPTGYDQQLFSDNKIDSNNVMNGIIIHTADDGVAHSSALLDMTPASSSASDWKDPALAAGFSYVDGDSGVSITNNGTDSTSASVDVNLGSGTCYEGAPSINVISEGTQWGASGSSLSYSFSIANQNNSNCGSSTYQLAVTLPTGWGAEWSLSSVNLLPGSSQDVTLTVNSSTSATDGFFDLPVSASDQANSTYTNSASVTYVVDNSSTSNQAPNAQNDAVTLATVSPVSIDVLSNDTDPEGKQLTVVSVTQGAKGNVAINGDGSLTYSPAKRFKNSDSFTYVVSDGELTAEATVTVTLQSSGDDGGDTGDNTGTKGGGKGKNK